MFQFIILDLPVSLRRDSRLFWLACVIFFLPLTAAFLLAQLDAGAVYLVYDAQEVIDFKRMFHPQWQDMAAEQGAPTDQFLFYIWNNNLVGLQLFLLGAFLGIGTLLFLAYSGFSLGLILGYLISAGLSSTVWPGILTHSAFEILATLVAAVAGMKWGFSLVLLTRVSRRHDFARRLTQAVSFLLNAIVLFTIAALVEAYWSPVLTSNTEKYITGFASWLMLIAWIRYFGFKPRKHENR